MVPGPSLQNYFNYLFVFDELNFHSFFPYFNLELKNITKNPIYKYEPLFFFKKKSILFRFCENSIFYLICERNDMSESALSGSPNS